MNERRGHIPESEYTNHRQVFLLLLGPSGAGKSSIARAMCAKNPLFESVKTVTSRPLRPSETEKMSVSREEFERMEEKGELFLVNSMYGNKYGLLRSGIEDILAEERVPILDFPLHRVDQLRQYEDILFKVYVTPPSLTELRKRLQHDNRSEGNSRYEESRKELLTLVRDKFNHPNIDSVLINRHIDDQSEQLMQLVKERRCILFDQRNSNQTRE